MTAKNTSEEHALKVAKEELSKPIDHSAKTPAEVEATSKARVKSAKVVKKDVPSDSSAKPSKAKPSEKPAKPKKTSKPLRKANDSSAKPKKAKTDDAPSSGQSGPKIKLEKDELNAKESKVLAALRRAKNGLALADLAERVFPRKAKAQANSWVRNSLRRLVRARFVKRAAEGEYVALKAA